MTIKEATADWIREWNAIPQSMISKLMQLDPYDWCEVTLPCPGNRVYVVNPPDGSVEDRGEILSYDAETDLYYIELDDETVIPCSKDDFEVYRDDILPMWGTMWSFGDSCDEWWLDHDDGIRKMSECRIRIYESDEYGYFFGIDGAGYDFYTAHWIPLYKTRGLQWHDKEETP